MPFINLGRENRYSTQERLIGGSGQRRLLKSKVAIVGIGALGCTVADILVRAGVGKVHLIDRDVVEIENLHRQHLYNEKDIGKAKADAARTRLLRINSEVKISSAIIDLSPENVDELKKKDIVIDCTDNFEARFLINDYCRKRRTAWVHGSAAKDVGSVILFRHDKRNPCFRCLFDRKETAMTCETDGVLAPLTTIVGGIQAQLALTYLLGQPSPETMLRINLHTMELEHVTIKQRQDCELCQMREFAFLEQKKWQRPVKLCGSSCYQLSGKEVNLKKLKEKLERSGKVEDYGYCLRFQNLSIFSDGRVIVKTESIDEAKALYTKFVGS